MNQNMDLLDYEDQNGFVRLTICQIKKNVRPIHYFNTVHESTQLLLKLQREFDLDLRFCGFYNNPLAVRESREISNQHTEYPNVDEYNEKVTRAIESLTEHTMSFLILDKGRVSSEKSYVYYKDNKVHAIGFISNDLEIQDIEEIIGQENLVLNNFYMNNLALNYANQYPNKVIVLKGLTLEEC